MKVCCLGNMNYTGYVMAKLLRRRGIDANLLLYKNEFFLPEDEDENLKNNYPPWIKKVKWGNYRSFFLTSKKQLLQDLDEFDVYLSCGFGPAFLKKVGFIKKNIFLPYGSDLCVVPFPKKNIKGALFYYIPGLWLFSYIQRRGIQESAAVTTIPVNHPDCENAIKKLNLSNALLLAFPLDLEKFDPEKIATELNNSSDENIKVLKRLRSEFELIVFSQTRHVWTKETLKSVPWDDKRNEILIRGFAEFLKVMKSALLILVEKGQDVGASKDLINKLNIDKNVYWIPEMSREKVRFYLYNADITADQFATGGYGATTIEGLALGKPVLVYITSRFEKEARRALPPSILNVKTPDQIKEAICSFVKNREKYLELGVKTRNWVNKYYGEELIDDYIRLFYSLMM